MRTVSPEQARQVYAILVQHAGASDSADEAFAFTAAVCDQHHPCREYRFGGTLGSGGKFRNNGNRDNTPYIDCYEEHLTPRRRKAIEAVNAILAQLFGPDPEETATFLPSLGQPR